MLAGCGLAETAAAQAPPRLPGTTVPGFAVNYNPWAVEFWDGGSNGGYFGSRDSVDSSYYDPPEGANNEEFENDLCAGNPILIGSGIKIQLDTDFGGQGEMALGLTRRYSSSDSASTYGGVFGDNWSSNLDHSISRDGCYASLGAGRDTCPSSPQVVEVFTNLGQRHSYHRGGDGIYRNPSDAFSSIQKVLGGYYELKRSDDSVMRFRPDGRVERIENTHGLRWTYGYQTLGDGTQQITITRSGGRSLSLTIGAGPYPRATTVIDPAGKSYSYTYGEYGRLASVTYPGGAADARNYTYSLGRLVGIGIGGQPFATFDYHDDGRGKMSFHAGEVEKVELSYGTEFIDGLGNVDVTTVTNALGATTRYKFHNDKLRLIDRDAAPDCPAASASTEYDGNGHVSRKVDWNGVASSFTYNANGQLLERVDGIHPVQSPQGMRYTQHSWDTKNRIIETREGAIDVAAGNVRRPVQTVALTYNSGTAPARNRIASIVRSSHIRASADATADTSLTTTFAYTVHSGNIVQSITEDGPAAGADDSFVTTRNTHGDVISTTNSLGHTAASEYNQWGRATRITGLNGAVNEIAYDDRGRVASETVYHSGVARATTYTYDRFGNVASIAVPGQPRRTFAYDDAGRLISSGLVRPFGRGTRTDSIQLQYNALSLPISRKSYMSDFFPGGCTPPAPDGSMVCTGGSSSYYLRMAELLEHDALGRLKSVSEAEPAPGPLSGVAYDPPLQAVRTTTYHYDANGNIARIVAPMQRTTRFEYDPLGRLIKSTDASNAVTTVAFGFGGSPLGLQEVVTPPSGGATTYTYDGFGNLLKEQNPDTGLTTYTYSSESGRLASLERGDGSTASFTYDALGRVTRVDAPQAVRRTANLESRMARLNPTPMLMASAQVIDNDADIYTYDTCSNGVGRLCAAVHGASYWTTAYRYTPHGAVDSQTESINGVDIVVNYSRDTFGRASSITYGNGTKVTYEYADGLPSAVKATVDGLTHTVVGGAMYWFGDRLSGYTYGNGASRSIGRNLQGRTTEIRAQGIQALTHGYDTAGRIGQIGNALDGDATQNFGYSAVDRLISSTRTGANESWALNPIGHRTQHVRAGQAYALSYAGSTNRLTGISGALARSYGTDALGRRKTQTDNGRTTDYYYDQANQQRYLARWQDVGQVCEPTGGCTERQAGVWEYGYNHRGQRMYKTDNAVVEGSVTGRNWVTRYVYAPGGELLAETGQDYYDSATLNSVYVWFGGEVVGVIRGGKVYYVANDHLGRAEVIADGSRNEVWRARNLAFHREVFRQDASFGDFNPGFPGQYFDRESGLYYNWHRYYDPSTGRYTQSDPIGLDGGLNTYAYVGGSPTQHVDPTGLTDPQRIKDGMLVEELARFKCKGNAVLNGAAQGTPGVGLYLSLTNNNFSPFSDSLVTPYGDDGTIIDPFRLVAGPISAAALVIDSPIGHGVMEWALSSQFRDLTTGNKQSRREALAANRAIATGGRRTMAIAGKATMLLGFAAGGVVGYSDYQKCSCAE